MARYLASKGFGEEAVEVASGPGFDAAGHDLSPGADLNGA
jgi:hypothetical protein